MSNAKIKKLLKFSFLALKEVKGVDIVALDLTSVESYTDYILIASGTSERQVKALSDRVIEKVFKNCHKHPLGVEGYENSRWVLIDFGDVVCHVFFDEMRPVYQLENMWPQLRPMDEAAIERLLAAGGKGQRPKKRPRLRMP